MARLRDIHDDPRWEAFCARYRYDWTLAAWELFGIQLTWQQQALARDCQEPGCRVAVASGHGTGKSSAAAAFVITHLLTIDNARCAIAAVKLGTVKEGIFKYMAMHWEHLRKSKHAWICQYFTMTQTRLYNRRVRGWAIVQKSGAPDKPEGLAGEHAPDLFYVIDEANGMFDEGAKVITSALTEARNRLLMISQPIRTSGYFASAFTTLAKVIRGGLLTPDRLVNADGVFTCHHFSSIDSPLVSASFIREKILEFGYGTPHFLIKILGQFAEVSDMMLLTRAECERAQKAKVKLHKGWSWVALCDVGNGRDACVLTIGRVSGSVHNNTLRFVPVRVSRYTGASNDARKFAYIIDHEVDSRYPGCVINIDAHGVGDITAEILINDLGRDVEKLTWGSQTFSKEQRRTYINQRAWASIYARNMIQNGRMKLCPGALIVDEFSRIPTKLDEKGRYQVESKENMRKSGVPSPDVADTFCFVPLARFTPASNTTIAPEQAARRSELLALLNAENNAA